MIGGIGTAWVPLASVQRVHHLFDPMSGRPLGATMVPSHLGQNHNYSPIAGSHTPLSLQEGCSAKKREWHQNPKGPS